MSFRHQVEALWTRCLARVVDNARTVQRDIHFHPKFDPLWDQTEVFTGGYRNPLHIRIMERTRGD